MDDQRSSVNFDSAVMWPFKLRAKHYLPIRGFSKSPFPPHRIAAMTCLMWFRDDLRLHDNQTLSRAATAASLSDAPLVAVVLDEPAYPSTRPLGGATTWWRQMNRRGCRIWGVGKQCICLAQTHRAGMGGIPGRTLDARRGRGARATNPAGPGQLR